MTNVLRHFGRALDWFRQDLGPTRIAMGAVLGLYLGFVPTLTLGWAVLLLMGLVLRINLLACLLSACVTWLLALGLESTFDTIGLSVLTQLPALTPLLAWMFHAPVLPFTRFYNSTVMGGFTLAT